LARANVRLLKSPRLIRDRSSALLRQPVPESADFVERPSSRALVFERSVACADNPAGAAINIAHQIAVAAAWQAPQ
jgi:hypothetical protein